MPRSHSEVNDGPFEVLVESYAVNERMFQIVLAHLDTAAWRAQIPGIKGRTIAATVVHVDNMRRKWLRLSAPHLKLPAPLDRTHCTQTQARAALARSATCCIEMLTDALIRRPRRVKIFLRDGWAKPWHSGPSMVAFMISHDAHHRGQICMLAHQLGYPLPTKATAGIWVWEKMWKDCGFTYPR